MLRAGKNPSMEMEYRHSGLTEKLYCEVVEAELLMPARLARMTAVSALKSHPAMDTEGAGVQLQTQYLDALSSIPYFTGGMSGEAMVDKERFDFANRYQEYKKLVMQGNDPFTALKGLSGKVKPVGKGGGR